MPNITRRTPNRPVRSLQREVDSLFDQFFNRSDEERRTARWAPKTDLIETDADFRLRLDVPGVHKEDIDINLKGGMLTVSGERTSERSAEGEDYVRVERSFGNFHRTFTLPQAVDRDNIEATYEDGVLSITVPKTEERSRRQIEIQ